MDVLEKLGLGTVQWGLPYGLTNKSGVTPDAVVRTILVESRRRGVKVLDTAALYGNAESVLGKNSLSGFCVITKTPRFSTPKITKEQADRLVSVFEQSLQKLGVPKVYGLLVHHAEDLTSPGGEKIVRKMQRLKERGLVTKIGVSVYDDKQIENVLKIFKPDLIQLPLSVFDQRMLENGWLECLKGYGVEVHARSVFLQGLLLMSPSMLPEYFLPVRPLLKRWHAAVQERGMTPIQAALSFVRDIASIDVVLIGVQDVQQLVTCINDFKNPAAFDATGLACNDPMFINPSLWKV